MFRKRPPPSELDEAVARVMEAHNRPLREEYEASRRPFLYTMVLGIQVFVIYTGTIAIGVALIDALEALIRMLGSTSFWVAVTCAAIYLAGEWAKHRLPATEREKQQRKSSSN